MVVTAIIAAAVAGAATAAATFIAGAALTWAAVGIAAIGAFISTGIAYLLAPKPQVGSSSRTARAMLRQAIVPARYVMGEARTGGWLFYGYANDRTLHLAIGISEGDIESITAFYADGERIPVGDAVESMTSANGRVLTYAGKMGEDSSMGADDAIDYTDRFKATCYLDSSTKALATANGQSLRDATGSEWAADDVVPIAWVHLELTQGAADRGEIAQPWRSARTSWEFLVKGMRITWPTQATAMWTDDAAAIRYWYDTNIRGRTVDETSFAAARAICMSAVVDSPVAIQFTPTKLEMQAGQRKTVRLGVSGTPASTVTATLTRASNDGLALNRSSVTIPGSFRVLASKPGFWRITATSPDANPATLLVEVT